MSDSNLFQEIEEDLQRKKLEALWKKYGGYVIAAILLVVVATAAHTAWESRVAADRQRVTTELLEILNSADKDARQAVSALEVFASANADTNQAALAKLQAAALAIKEGDRAKTLSIYDALSKDVNTNEEFRQLADLLFVQTEFDSADAAVLKSRLYPLLQDSPWKYTAMEFTALLSLKSGDKQDAYRMYMELYKNPDAPQTIAARAYEALRNADETGEQE